MHEGDIDPLETQEWLDALDSVLKNAGRGRTAFLLKTLAERAAVAGNTFTTSDYHPLSKQYPN